MSADRNFRNLFTSTDIFLWPLCVFIFSFITFLIVKGGPVTNDELKYLSVSIDTVQEPRILNRYFHIYLQKIFIYFFDDPFTSMQIFWSFIVSLTAALTFYSAMILSGSKNLMLAFISLLFFLIQPLIFRFVGVTYADYTVMLILTLSLAIYISTDINSLASKCKSILILGVLLVLSIKSKETGIVSFVFILGLIASNIEKYSCFRLSLYALIGILLGMLIMISLDALFLGDYLFSWRFSNIEQLLAFNSGERERVLGNWFSLIIQTDLIIPFVLYLLSLPYIVDQEKSIHIKFLYLLPIIIIIFLTFITGFGRLRIVPRYIVPIIPILSILAANYFLLTKAFKIKSINLSKKNILLLATTLLILISAAFYLRHTSNLISFNGWTPRLFLSNIYYPIIVSLILIAFLFIKKESRKFKLVFLMLFSILILPPLLAFPNNILFSSKIFNDRIYPLKAFEKYLNINDQTIMVFSSDAHKGSRGGLVPYYFNAKIGCSDPGERLPILCGNETTLQNYNDYFRNNPYLAKDKKFNYAILTIDSYINHWKPYYPPNPDKVIFDESKKYVLICEDNSYSCSVKN